MARPKKFKSAKALSEAWAAYKDWCDSRKAMTHGFSSRNSKFVSKELPRSVTYTVEGFCAWAGITRSAFYETYPSLFPDMFTRIREECEIDARMKFELGIIDPKLAALWMGKYGYHAKVEMPVNDSREDDPITKSLKEAAHAITQTDGNTPLAVHGETGSDM